MDLHNSGSRISRRRRRTHSSTYAAVIGVATGVVLTGLVVPYVRVQTSVTAPVAVSGTLTPGGGNVAVTPSTSGTSSSSFGGSPGGANSLAASGRSSISSGNVQNGSTAPATSSSAPGDPTVPVPGVTATEIKVGIGLIDVGQASQFGFNFDIGNEQARYQALINKINEAGGINGRKIVPYYQTFNATDPTASAQAACLAWTQDDHVFSVLVESQFPTAAEVCVFGQGDTPFITTQGTEQSYYANGLFFSTQASDNRTLTDQADYLAANGTLTGKTIGVVSGNGTDELAVDDTLLPRLKALGYSVKDVEVVPDDTSGVQREPIAISNLKAAGVNLVIMAANVILAGPFVQAANRAGYDPQYALSDFNNEINDQVANYYPSSFQGTVGLSTHLFPDYRAGGPFTAADQACLDVVHPVDPKVLPATNSAFEVAMGNCAIFDVWSSALFRAGRDLTQASFLAAMGRSGIFAIPGTQGGSFTPTKHDAADYEQAVAWQESCTCWELVNGLSTPVRKLQ